MENLRNSETLAEHLGSLKRVVGRAPRETNRKSRSTVKVTYGSIKDASPWKDNNDDGYGDEDDDEDDGDEDARVPG